MAITKISPTMPPTVPATIGVFEVLCDFTVVSATMLDVSEAELWDEAEALDAFVETVGEGRGAAVPIATLTTEET